MRLERRVAALEGPSRDAARDRLERMSNEELIEEFVRTVRHGQEFGLFDSPEWDGRIDHVRSGQSFSVEEWEDIKAQFARIY